MGKVDADPDGCWLWTGALMTAGYGQFRSGGQGSKVVKAHRWLYEQTVGPIPDGHVLHHLCEVKACVRPDHLEPVLLADHVRHHCASQLRDAATHQFVAPAVTDSPLLV